MDKGRDRYAKERSLSVAVRERKTEREMGSGICKARVDGDGFDDVRRLLHYDDNGSQCKREKKKV